MESVPSRILLHATAFMQTVKHVEDVFAASQILTPYHVTKNSGCTSFFFPGTAAIVILYRHRRHKIIHHNKMTEAATHHKQMENFMCSELFMLRIKHRHF